MKILLIDDSLLVRNTIKRMLNQIGYEGIILEAKDGKSGIDVVKNELPDILIVDLLMPIIDGEEVVRQIKTGTQKCFIAVLTSNIQKPVRERLIASGADLFVEKPITLEKIKMIMKQFNDIKGG